VINALVFTIPYIRKATNSQSYRLALIVKEKVSGRIPQNFFIKDTEMRMKENK